uniref:Uncharacterized protein n=1 Tax=Vespula pensylvanica TaxID=30213 RepID=A0A834U9Q2_VESPE|nr:hypothetical protein H0235_009099 [Vespula pensylvanica]
MTSTGRCREGWGGERTLEQKEFWDPRCKWYMSVTGEPSSFYPDLTVHAVNLLEHDDDQFYSVIVERLEGGLDLARIALR